MIYFRFVRVFLTSLTIFLPLLSNAMDIVRHPPPENRTDVRSHYYIDMMRLALDKTVELYGPYKQEAYAHVMPQSRSIASLRQGRHINILWTMTSMEREEQLLPVRIPLLKGLLGYRIFIIRQGDQARFNRVASVDDLRLLQAGQGHDWPDTSILEANGFSVIGSSSYEGLFQMLANNRFDYFPRGAHEPWAEVITYGNGELTIEKNFAIQYHSPSFFFVNKDDKYLAERIEVGLRLAIEDGSFDHLLHTHQVTSDIFKSANLSNRTIFRIKNPLLTEETKNVIWEKELWYQP